MDQHTFRPYSGNRTLCDVCLRTVGARSHRPFARRGQVAKPPTDWARLTGDSTSAASNQ